MKPLVGPEPGRNTLDETPSRLSRQAGVVDGRTHRRWIQQTVAAGRMADVATHRLHQGWEYGAELQTSVEAAMLVLGSGHFGRARQRDPQKGGGKRAGVLVLASGVPAAAEDGIVLGGPMRFSTEEVALPHASGAAPASAHFPCTPPSIQA